MTIFGSFWFFLMCVEKIIIFACFFKNYDNGQHIGTCQRTVCFG